MHEGSKVTISRVQDIGNTINPSFAKTSRKCPPFCIQPASIAPGVEVVGELEVLDYLQRRAAGDDTILLIDSRGSKWVAKGTIPGSVNIHYKRLSLADAMEDDIAAILENQFGVLRLGEFWDFSNAKTLVLYCNGIWCGQSPSNIRSLLQLGYPAHKLKWYRGGMQAWETVGLTTVKPGE
jgi:rhodanese-related sulfurtransferase